MQNTIHCIALTVFLGAFSLGSARADIIGKGKFTISSIVGGPYAGDTFTGTFTYDATKAAFSDVPLLSFTTDFPSWAGGLLADTSSFFGPHYFAGSPGLSFFYAPAPVGNTNAFALGVGGAPVFAYGTTLVVGSSFTDVGQGTFMFTTSTATPELGLLALLATGLAGVVGSLLRKARS